MKYLSILTSFKNESMVLKEWLDHHLTQGFEHFYLIDNGSTDDFMSVLTPYIDQDIVTLFYIPELYSRTQNFNKIYDKIKHDTAWISICDVDDYWYTDVGTVAEYVFIAERENYSEISTISKVFGTNTNNVQPKSVRQICSQIYSSPKLKSIVKTTAVDIVKAGSESNSLLKSGSVTKFELKDININTYKETSLERFLDTRLYRTHPDYENKIRSWVNYYSLQFFREDFKLAEISQRTD